MRSLVLWCVGPVLILAVIFGPLRARAGAVSAPLTVVAAEHCYGDIAKAIGGPEVRVTSILRNPERDPHLFEVSPRVGRAVQGAGIVIYNGIGYDPWMVSLLRAGGTRAHKILIVADLVGARMGDNPHLWYDPKTGPALGRQLAAVFTAADPAHAAAYSRRLEGFLARMNQVDAAVRGLRARIEGTAVSATEPVYGLMLAALGLKVRDEAFQRAVMNDTEPTPGAVAALIGDLKNHRVHLLIYNRQAADPLARRMAEIAGEAKVPVVGVSETEPEGVSYPDWLLATLHQVEQALASRAG